VQKALAKCFLKIDSSSEKINAIPYIQHKNNSSATNKIIIHYLNHNLDQETKNIKTNIPYKITEYNAEKTISFTIPKLLIYGIISISNNNLK
jgi:hypothetical protein